MTYPYGSPTQYSAQPSAAYGVYWPQFTGPADRRNPPGIPLVWAVLALGLATYVVSYGPALQPGGMGWGVRFSTLAALVAVLGLLSRQSAHTKFMAVLAVMGFLDALSRWITAFGDQNRGWATIVIVVLTALQALTAVAVLLAQLGLLGASDRGVAPYDAYAPYAQAAQQYYDYAASDQQVQQRPAWAQGTAQAEAAARAQAQQSAAERDALYAEYLSAQQSGPNPAASSRQAGGLGQTAQPAAGTGTPTSGPAQSIRPGNDPAMGSPTQSSS